jgi:hypothetical protein
MHKTYAAVNPAGGVVSNIVVGDDIDTVSGIVGPCVEQTDATGPAAIGYTWDGSTFTPPAAPEPEPVEDAASSI